MPPIPPPPLPSPESLPDRTLKDRRLRVVLCGYGPLGLALLHGLLDCGELCEIVGVFRWTARNGNQWEQEPCETEFSQCVTKAGLYDFHGKGINSYAFSAFLNQVQPDLLLIGSWGEIVQTHVLEHPGCLSINCHPAYLPQHRGANPYSSVILTTETETGVTFHRMLPTLDSGPIFLQRRIPLYGTDTSLLIRDRCAETAKTMLPQLLTNLREALVEGHPLLETPQDESKATYYPAPQDKDGLLDWDQSPDALSRQIRALYPWILPFSYLGGKHRVYFYQPRLVTRTLQNQYPATRPGTIVCRFGASPRLYIATSASDVLLEVSACGMTIAGGRLIPNWLGRIAALCLLHPGCYFATPLK